MTPSPPIPSCSNENFYFHAGDYSFGFQAQEQDEEMWGGSVTYKYRVEDPRLGRFFAVDPLHAQYPWNSNYSFSENRLVDSKELEGLERVEYWVNKKCLTSFNWHEADYNVKEAFLRKHDIEGSFGIDYHPNDEVFSGGSQSEIWRFYSLNCDGMSAMVMYRYANEADAKAGKSSSHKLFSGLTYDLSVLSSNLEGTTDGDNSGGALGGTDGWNNGGKQLFFGTISVVTAPLSIAAGGVYTVMGYFSLVNGVDDMFTNQQRESLTQQLTSDPNYKEIISKVKVGGTIVTCIGGIYQLWQLGASGTAASTEVVPTLIATGNDLNSVMSSVKPETAKP
jgi:hypothetical protein